MEQRGSKIHIDTDEARGGSSPNVVRWVLGIGLLLALIFMSLAWIIPALSRGGETQPTSVSRQMQDDGTSDTDGIVLEGTDEIPAAVEAPSEGGVPTIDNNDQAEGAAPAAAE